MAGHGVVGWVGGFPIHYRRDRVLHPLAQRLQRRTEYQQLLVLLQQRSERVREH